MIDGGRVKVFWTDPMIVALPSSVAMMTVIRGVECYMPLMVMSKPFLLIRKFLYLSPSTVLISTNPFVYLIYDPP